MWPLVGQSHLLYHLYDKPRLVFSDIHSSVAEPGSSGRDESRNDHEEEEDWEIRPSTFMRTG